MSKEIIKDIPKELFQRWKILFNEDFEAFIEAIITPPKPCIRLNTLKAKKEEILELLKERDVKLTEVPWYDKGYFINVEEEETIGNWWEHFAGLIYIQSADSMIPPIVLSPMEEEYVLDMCASPGSKTTQIADMMKNKGIIIANDINTRRIKALTSNLERMGVINTIVTMTDGVRFGKLMPNYFDKVLVDAPCSAEGTIRKSYKAIYNWTPNTPRKMSNIQKALIISAYKALKPNGVLVYSTCTFSPEENEEVVSYLVEKHEAYLEEVNLRGLRTRSGIVEWMGKKYNQEVSKAIRIYPHENEVGGFFIAKIRKPNNK
ncbi:MAG: RsmB/NOP family class I SAM-dependent RNA methyltransferase [candidate division WOR-3 bacterium]